MPRRKPPSPPADITFSDVATLMLYPRTWLDWLRRNPDDVELVADTYRLSTALAKDTGWQHPVLLDRIGCSVKEPRDVAALTPDRLRRCRDFMVLVEEVVVNLDLDQDMRLAVGRVVSLYKDAGRDLDATRTAMLAKPEGELSAIELIGLGEIARAFATAREHLVPQVSDNTKGRAAQLVSGPEEKPHLSAARLALLNRGRVDLLGRDVAARMEKHLSQCEACARARDAVHESSSAAA